jgi:(1->4)-alpha-D-glucan 1-alpha-D-glucosylmutase
VQALVDLSGCDEAQQKVQSEPFQERPACLREAEMVDYEGVALAKEEVLRVLWRHFERHELTRIAPRRALPGLHARARATIGRHALFEAPAGTPACAGSGSVGLARRGPRITATATARRRRRSGSSTARTSATASGCSGWPRCSWSPASATRARRGMGIGLYCDLAVGVNGGGAETWVEHALFALGMHAGAPPDPLAPPARTGACRPGARSA